MPPNSKSSLTFPRCLLPATYQPANLIGLRISDFTFPVSSILVQVTDLSCLDCCGHLLTALLLPCQGLLHVTVHTAGSTVGVTCNRQGSSILGAEQCGDSTLGLQNPFTVQPERTLRSIRHTSCYPLAQILQRFRNSLKTQSLQWSTGAGRNCSQPGLILPPSGYLATCGGGGVHSLDAWRELLV